MTSIDTVVIGAGHAGLSVSRLLTRAGCPHVVLDRGSCCGQGGCGCAPKIDVLARSEDVPRVARLLQERWRALALREGTIDMVRSAQSSPAPHAIDIDADSVPCPACGTVGPLAAGACADCGLQLA